MLIPGKLYQFNNGKPITILSSEIVTKCVDAYKQIKSKTYNPTYITQNDLLIFICQDYVNFEGLGLTHEMMIFVYKSGFLAIDISNEDWAIQI